MWLKVRLIDRLFNNPNPTYHDLLAGGGPGVPDIVRHLVTHETFDVLRFNPKISKNIEDEFLFLKNVRKSKLPNDRSNKLTEQ